MKQQIIGLNKKLLLVELPERAKFISIEGDKLYYYQEFLGIKNIKSYRKLSEMCKYIGKLTDIKEEQFDGLVFRSKIVGYKDYNHKDKQLDKLGLFNALLEMKFKIAKESFFSKLEKDEIYFTNPLGEFPTKHNTGLEYGMEYISKQASWEEAQEKVWDKERTWLFEIM